MKRELPPPPGFTLQFSLFISLHWKTAWLPTNGERRLTNYPQWQKPSFLSALLYTEEPLSQNIPYQKDLSYLSQWKDRCSLLTVHPGLYKAKCQKHRVSAWKLTIFFHVFELASDTAIASRWGLKCVPCLDKAIVCELPTLYLSRKTSFIAAEVP